MPLHGTFGFDLSSCGFAFLDQLTYLYVGVADAWIGCSEKDGLVLE